MSTISVEDFLLLRGGKLWTSYGYRRVYINADNENFGGEKFFYDAQKDNFSNAEIGEKIREEAKNSKFDTVDVLCVNETRYDEEYEKLYNKKFEEKGDNTIYSQSISQEEAVNDFLKKFSGKTVSLRIYMRMDSWAAKDGGMEASKEFDRVMKLKRGETRETKLLTYLSKEEVKFTVAG